MVVFNLMLKNISLVEVPEQLPKVYMSYPNIIIIALIDALISPIIYQKATIIYA